MKFEKDNLAAIIENTLHESSWETFYDKYAPLMYGTILNIAADKALAEKIFIEAFIGITKDHAFRVLKESSMTIFLFMYAKDYSTDYLQRHR